MGTVHEQTPAPTPIQSSLVFLGVVAAMLLIAVLLREALNPAAFLWINQLVVFLLPVLIYSLRTGVNWRELVRYKPVKQRDMWLAALLGIAGFPLFFLISSVVEVIIVTALGPSPELLEGMQALTADPITFFLFIIGIVFLAPVFEEVLFRGFIQQGLGGYSHRRGWILAGLLFGALHFGNSISNAVGAVFLGLLLSYLAFKTGSIWPTILAHGVVNGLGALLVHIPSYLELPLSVEFMVNPLVLVTASLLLVIALRAVSMQSETAPSPPRRLDFKSIGAIGLSLVLLLGVAGYEISTRSHPPSQFSSMTFGRLDGEFELSTVEAPWPSALYLTFELRAREYDAEIAVIDEDADILWTVGHVTARDLSYQVVNRLVELPNAGTYQVVIRGSASDLEIDLRWQLRAVAGSDH